MATSTRSRSRHLALALALSAGTAALALTLAGSGTALAAATGATGSPGQQFAPRSGPVSPAADSDYESTLKLSDGSRVHVRLVKGTGVQERHQAAGATKWSAWKTLYSTKTDLCQGVGLAETNGTVSLIADFGRYCSDGEPPTESVAGVGTGDLSRWDIKTTKDFDGWQDTSISDDGSRVVFLYDSDSGLYFLRWERSGGFEEVHSPHD
jgi:hypothetical protein